MRLHVGMYVHAVLTLLRDHINNLLSGLVFCSLTFLKSFVRGLKLPFAIFPLSVYSRSFRHVLTFMFLLLVPVSMVLLFISAFSSASSIVSFALPHGPAFRARFLFHLVFTRCSSFGRTTLSSALSLVPGGSRIS
jgi:hypothetical protein